MRSQADLLAYFDQVTGKMRSIMAAKNSDYAGQAGAHDPFANFSRVEAFGVCKAETGFMTRMTDKFCRLVSFFSGAELKVKDESVQDTLFDLANYCILLAAYLEAKKSRAAKDEVNVNVIRAVEAWLSKIDKPDPASPAALAQQAVKDWYAYRG